MAILSTYDGQFAQTFTVNQQSGSYILLSTANKYVNKDIKITTDVRAATISISAPASASITSLTYTYNSTSGKYDVTGSKAISGTVTVTPTTTGWLNSAKTGSVSGTASLSDVTINKIGLSATTSTTGTVKGTPIINKDTTNSNVVTGTKTTSKPSNGFYLAVSSAAITGTVTAVPAVSSAGYGTTTAGTYTATNSSGLSVGANASATTYFPINSGSLSVLNTSADTNITSLSYTYNSTNGNFNVSGSGSISGTTTVTATEGYITSGTSGTYSGTASLSGVTIDKIGIKATLSGAINPITPYISKQNVPNGVTDAASGAATTTAPSSGVYVAVQSPENCGFIIATPSVSSAGYGTPNNDQYTSTNAMKQVGAAASAVTYIPITIGSTSADTASADTTLYTTDGSNAGVNIGAVTNVIGTKVTTEPTSGYYVALTVSGGGNSRITTAGWIAAGSLGTASTSETQYYPIQAGAYSTSGGGLTANTGYANVTANACYTGGTYDTTDSVSISSQSSDTEGYYKITVEGYGNVKRAAIKKTASTAGYIPVNTSGTQTSAATNKNSNKGYAYLYIKKSTITSNSITPSTSAQTVTISEGYYPSDRTVTIAAMTAGTVTTTYSNSGMSTYFTSQSTSSGASVTITPQYTNTAGYIAAHSSATNNGGIGYWKIRGTSITQGTTTISGTAPNQTATRGTATWGTGWITSGTMAAASFSNTASSGITYVDITDTPAAPVLSTSDGYLYINQGYTDNLKIHIGKFISPDVTISATDQILASYTAYDSNGNLLTGTIPSKNASDITRSGKTITIPYGKYEGTVGNHNAVTYNITEGDYSASAANTTAGTITPSVAINNASTYGFTTTQPSGTNGTNYLTIDPGGSVTTKWKSTATATITTAGYIATGSKTATVEGTPTIAAGTNYYVPIITPTFGGGAVTGSSTTAITVTGMSTSSDATSYYIDASSTGSATRGVVTYTNSAGAIAAHNATTALSAPSSATAINSSADRVYIPAAVGAVNMTAGNGSCAYSSANSTNITVSDTDTSGIQIGFTGSGQVTGTAAITTAGYAPVTNSFATSNATSSNSATATKYVTGVTLEAPSSGTRYFDITVPNGDGGDTITFRFTVDSSCNVTVAGPD